MASFSTYLPRILSPDMDHDIFQKFPYLSQFMGAYFYQSALEFSDSEEAIIDDFLSGNASRWYVTGLWCDIQRMIELRSDDLLVNFNALIKPDYIIGSTDSEANAWLTHLADKCAVQVNALRITRDVPI